MGRHSDQPLHVGAKRPARLGARARTRCLPDGDLRRGDHRQRRLGPDCSKDRARGSPVSGRRRDPPRHSALLAVEIAERRHCRSFALDALEAPAGGRGHWRRTRPGPRQDRVLDRPGGPRALPPRHGRTGPRTEAGRRLRLGHIRGHGTVRALRGGLLDRNRGSNSCICASGSPTKTECWKTR